MIDPARSKVLEELVAEAQAIGEYEPKGGRQMTERQMIELLLATAGNVIRSDESGIRRSIELMRAIQGLRAAHAKVTSAMASQVAGETGGKNQ